MTSPTIRALGGVMLLAVLVALAYQPAWHGGFLLDDDLLLTENAIIKSPNGLAEFWLTDHATDYWPVTNSVLWVEWRLWGMDPTGYHAVNLALHVADALLLWLVLHRLSIPGAYAAALLFAVHPVNVESVAWISSLKNVLSLFFSLVAVACYLTADDRGMGRRSCRDALPDARQGSPASPHAVWYGLSLAAFLLAMLSKGSAVVVPLLLLAIVWWRRPVAWRDLVGLAPFFVAAAGLTVVNVWFQTHSFHAPIRDVTVWDRVAGAGAVVLFYLSKAVLPIRLTFVYPQWHVQSDSLRWWLPLTAVVAVTVGLWRWRGPWGRPLTFAWVVFCVALLPVMGFADVGFMKHSLVADRYAHTALISVVTLAAAAWATCMHRCDSSHRFMLGMAGGMVVVALAGMTWRQCGIYHDATTLYTAVLAENPLCAMAHNNLGNEMLKAGRVPEAMQRYQEALRLDPSYQDAQVNLDTARHHAATVLCSRGLELAKAGRFEEAIEPMQQAIHLQPDFAEASCNLGNVFASLNRHAEAVECYRQALASSPGSFVAASNLAMVLETMGRRDEAMAAAARAIDAARADGRDDDVQKMEAWISATRDAR